MEDLDDDEVSRSTRARPARSVSHSGQQYNAHGDRFTLTTVIYTVAMFFAGLGAVLRRHAMRVVFLGLSVLVASGALWYMLQTPFA